MAQIALEKVFHIVQILLPIRCIQIQGAPKVLHILCRRLRASQRLRRVARDGMEQNERDGCRPK